MKMKVLMSILCLSAASLALGSMDDDSAILPVCQGKSKSNVAIDAVGLSDPFIRLRNTGGQTLNLTGWKLTGKDTDGGITFGTTPSCSNITLLEPSRTLTLRTTTPCALSDSIITSGGEVNLLNPFGASIALVKIHPQSENGSTLYAQGSGFVTLNSNADILTVLQSMGKFTQLLAALKSTGVDQKISLNVDPNYVPPSPPKKPEDVIVPTLPWWYNGPNRVDRSKIAPAPPPSPPPPPPPAGIPPRGPYTILAPTDDAMDTFRRQLGGGEKKLPWDQFLALPELRDILQFHITPGAYSTADMYNGTMIYSGMGVPFVPFNDACLTEGHVMISDSCIDKPTPDNFTCMEQVAFDKCLLPYMTSALAAQWGGGFCQFSCQRCQCSPPSVDPMEDGNAMDGSMPCAAIISADRIASNGLIQVISRVLVPPPAFSKEASMAVMRPVDGTVAASSAAYKPSERTA